MYRDDFNRLINFEAEADTAIHAADWIAKWLVRTAQYFADHDHEHPRSLIALGNCPQALQAWLAQHLARETAATKFNLLNNVAQPPPPDWIAKQYNLQQRLPLACLQLMAQAAYAHRQPFMDLFQLYQTYGLNVWETMSQPQKSAFSADPVLLDEAFILPTVHLAMALQTERYLSEILGLSLGYLIDYQPSENSDDNLALRKIVAIIDSYVATQERRSSESAWSRIMLGVRAHGLAVQELYKAISSYQQPKADVTEQVLAIIRAKAQYAKSEHHHAKLGDKLLNEWFNQDVAKDFLHTLADSQWIDRQQPEQSRLFTELLSFTGPMYKIFTTEEQAVLLTWIKSLTAPVDSAKWPLFSQLKPTSTRRSPEPVKTISCRALFHQLLNLASYPNAYTLAENHVQSIFKGCAYFRYLPFFGHVSQPRQYSAVSLQEFIDGVFHQATQTDQPRKNRPTLEKSEYLWLLEQLAPTALVDGCWLQNIAKLQFSYPQVMNSLLCIFDDEIGNGKISENHCNVYRLMLQQQGIQLPEVSSTAFIQQAEYRDANFNIATHMLALSLFPRKYLPELLGLNLAIELSGLGGFYAQVARDLRYWEIDSCFFSLHNSIDNPASGHTYLAQTAINDYLETVLILHGPEVQQQNWQRIWLGYQSLWWVTQQTWLSIALRFIRRFSRTRIKVMMHNVWPLLPRLKPR